MRTVIITGGNSGLGRKTAEKIAKNKDYTVILACRNMDRAKKAEKDLLLDEKSAFPHGSFRGWKKRTSG